MLGATLGSRDYLERVCTEIRRLDLGQIEASNLAADPFQIISGPQGGSQHPFVSRS